MKNSEFLTTLFINFLIVKFWVCNALNCSTPPKVIYVNNSGQQGTFKRVQEAIDSVPEFNTQWTHIRIAAGVYEEQVIINRKKPCIFLIGAGSSSTSILGYGHQLMNETATFASLADDVVAMGITFENKFNKPPNVTGSDVDVPALAAKIIGDRNAFYNCSFKGVQDTLWDCQGRHYFLYCYIQGAIDFIFGDGQSIYQRSSINFSMGADEPKEHEGSITAQKRESIESPTGFVFKECSITGNAKTLLLGRAYGPFSRVIIANSYLDDVILPYGWDAWNQTGHEGNLTYVEEGNSGPGSDKTNRVQWMKHMDRDELNKFLDISYIDQEGWIKQHIFSTYGEIEL